MFDVNKILNPKFIPVYLVFQRKSVVLLFFRGIKETHISHDDLIQFPIGYHLIESKDALGV